MKNKNGTTENMTEYHPNGNKSYEFKRFSDGFIEYNYDKNGKKLTFKRGFNHGPYEKENKIMFEQNK